MLVVVHPFNGTNSMFFPLASVYGALQAKRCCSEMIYHSAVVLCMCF